MIKITSSFGCITMLVFGCLLLFTYTSTRAQTPGVVFESDRMPIIPPLPNLSVVGIKFENGVVQLDGMECDKCSFENVTFEYSGGLVSLKDSSWKPGTIKLVFKGAAANAMLLKDIFAEPQPPHKAIPIPKSGIPQTEPKEFKITINNERKIDIIIQ